MASDNELKTLDYRLFLADLEAKRAALDQAIAAVRMVLSGGALATSIGEAMQPMADGVSLALHGGEVPVGAFLVLSIPEAAKLCLQIIKKKSTSREIAEHLQKGGIETKSKTFPLIVHSVLMRVSRSGGSIVKLDRSHWGLAEWYPASMRTSAAVTKRANGKKTRRVSRKLKEQVVMPKPDETALQSVPERISQLLRSKPGTELSAKEIAAPLGIKSNVAALLLGKLVARKRVEKTREGKFKAIAA